MNKQSAPYSPSAAGALFPRLLSTWGLVMTLGSAHAATQSYTGVFSHDDDRTLIAFTLATAANVTMQTWSFGGGINGAGESIAAGGFAPVLSLFDMNEQLIGLAQAGAAGCGAGNPDATTGFCWDVAWNGILDAGSYRAVLTQDGNAPLGSSLSDGFQQDGQGNYTGPAYLGVAGSFVLVDGSQRVGHWALDLTAPVPEPETWALLLAGLAILGRTLPRPDSTNTTE